MPHQEYLLNGAKVPSVTTILSRVIKKPYLEKWRGALGNRECDAITKRATDLGKKFHAAIAAHSVGNVIPEMEDPEVKPMMKVFVPWWKAQGFASIYQEHTVISAKYGYGGSLDDVSMKGPLCILNDWKSSKHMDVLEYEAQVAAYAKAFEEQHGTKIDGGQILRVDKPYCVDVVDKELWVVRDLNKAFDYFMHCFELYKELVQFDD